MFCQTEKESEYSVWRVQLCINFNTQISHQSIAKWCVSPETPLKWYLKRWLGHCLWSGRNGALLLSIQLSHFNLPRTGGRKSKLSSSIFFSYLLNIRAHTHTHTHKLLSLSHTHTHIHIILSWHCKISYYSILLTHGSQLYSVSQTRKILLCPLAGKSI